MSGAPEPNTEQTGGTSSPPNEASGPVDGDTPRGVPARLPVARVEHGRRRSEAPWAKRAAWLLPVAALILSLVLLGKAWQSRGPLVRVQFAGASGLRAGDPVIWRGARVGEVTDVRVKADLSGVVVEARLVRAAAALSRGGARYWIVHPEVSLTRVSGLETIVGPRYLQADMSPAGTKPVADHADSPASGMFGGLDAPPTGETWSDGRTIGEGDLRLTLRTPSAKSLSAGAPVLYRGIKVGEVTGKELGPGAQSALVHAVVDHRWRHLVRTNSKWWNVSGFGLEFGLVGGLTLKTASLESLVQGGVAFTTPDRPGAPVASGSFFELFPEAEKEWPDWSPNLAPESSAPSPQPSAAPGKADSTTPTRDSK